MAISLERGLCSDYMIGRLQVDLSPLKLAARGGPKPSWVRSARITQDHIIEGHEHTGHSGYVSRKQEPLNLRNVDASETKRAFGA